ncbi:MAG: anaerobic ribonucleoside-triphosphate reductase [archaeon]
MVVSKISSSRLINATEEFYSQDKTKLSYWIAKTENYSKKRTIEECISCGVPEEEAVKIANEIDAIVDSRVKMSEVRPLIYALIKDKFPESAKKLKGGQIYVQTSSLTYEEFDPMKIVNSLMIETGLDEKTAKEIAKEVERFIKTSKIENVTSALIRELTNVKLLERGLEEYYRMYVRVGMPVYDITSLLLKGCDENANLQYNPETIHKFFADQVAKEYALIRWIPKELRDAHINGAIHIHDLDYFITRPFCFSHDIRFFLKNGLKVDGVGNHTAIAGPAKHPEVAFIQAAKVLASSQVNCGGGQGYSYFNVFLAPLLRGEDYKKIKQCAQLFVYEMSQMYVARGGQMVFSSIDLDIRVPKFLRDVPAIGLGGKIVGTYADYEEEARTLLNAFIDIYEGGDYIGKPFNFPKFEIQIYPEYFSNLEDIEIINKISHLSAKFGTPYYIIHQPYMPEFSCYQCCSYLMPLDKSADMEDVQNGTIRGGSMQVVSINLPQIGYLSKEESNVYEIIDDRLEKGRKILKLKKEIIERNLEIGLLPFLSQKINEKGERYLEPSKQSYTFGIVGMNEMVKACTGYELHESKSAWLFGLKIMQYVKKRIAEMREEDGLNYALARTPAESTAGRFAKIDKKRFGEKAIVQGKDDGIYYTNSFHVRPSADIPLWERLKIEGSFHPLTDGGAMSHVWLTDAFSNASALTELTEKIAKKTAIQYMAYTKDFSVCDSCKKFIPGLKFTCPYCGSKSIQWWSRITGYYQNVKGWNKSKKQELIDRRRYDL